jgi:hypothetical protein
MKRKEWKDKYIHVLIINGLTKKQALENYVAIDEIDLDDDPEQMALDELSIYD